MSLLSTILLTVWFVPWASLTVYNGLYQLANPLKARPWLRVLVFVYGAAIGAFWPLVAVVLLLVYKQAGYSYRGHLKTHLRGLFYADVLRYFPKRSRSS